MASLFCDVIFYFVGGSLSLYFYHLSPPLNSWEETLDPAGSNTTHRNKIVPKIFALFILTPVKNLGFFFQHCSFWNLRIKYDILKHLYNTLQE